MYLGVAGPPGELAQQRVASSPEFGVPGQHDLGDLVLSRELGQGIGRVRALKPDELTAELRGQRGITGQYRLKLGRRRPLLLLDHRHPEVAGELCSERCRAPDQRFHPGPRRGAGQDGGPLRWAAGGTGLPVAGHLAVGVLGDDGEGLLAQGAEQVSCVARPQRLLDVGGRHDLTSPDPVGEHRRRSVHQLDLISQRDDRRLIQGPACRAIAPAGRPAVALAACCVIAPDACRAITRETSDVSVGRALAAPRAGGVGAVSRAIPAAQAGEVHRGDDVDAGVGEPPGGGEPAHPAGVGDEEIVDAGHLGLAGQHLVGVERDPVADQPQAIERGGHAFPGAAVHRRDHHIGAAGSSPPGLFEHGGRDAAASRVAQVHPDGTTRPAQRGRRAGRAVPLVSAAGGRPGEAGRDMQMDVR